MKQIFKIFLVVFLSINLTNAQQSKVIEGLSVQSKILNSNVNFSIYLPPDYQTSERSYPVVYLLHGYTDDETAWIQYGEVNRVLDEGIASGKLPPMIVVMPDAGVTWYINNHDGKVRYEDMFIQEFLPYIESTYRIRTKKRYRGIAGLSMGGYGSFLFALKYPDLFVACAPLSAAIYTENEVISYSQERWDKTEAVMYGKGLKGKKRLTKHWVANNPLHLLKNLDIKKVKSVRYYFDCGDDDFLYKGNAATHILLKDLGIPHEFRMRDGHHNWIYWRSGISDALAFIGQSFH
jgi:enterochelin esterase-like enzyme